MKKFETSLIINFPTQETGSVVLETTAEDHFSQVLLFTSYTVRTLLNLGRNEVGLSLSKILQLPDSVEKLLTILHHESPDGIELVDYSGTPSRKRVEFEMSFSDERFTFFSKYKGFPLFSNEINYYAPNSTTLLLKYLCKENQEDESFLQKICKASITSGYLFETGAISTTNQIERSLMISLESCNSDDCDSEDEGKKSKNGNKQVDYKELWKKFQRKYDKVASGNSETLAKPLQSMLSRMASSEFSNFKENCDSNLEKLAYNLVNAMEKSFYEFLMGGLILWMVVYESEEMNTDVEDDQLRKRLVKSLSKYSGKASKLIPEEAGEVLLDFHGILYHATIDRYLESGSIDESVTDAYSALTFRTIVHGYAVGEALSKDSS